MSTTLEIPEGALLPVLQVGNETAYTNEEAIYVLTRYLAGRCDGARQQDGVGFNKLHAGIGHELAELPLEAWSERQVWAMYKVLGVYKNTQISEWWDSVEYVPEPAKGITRDEASYRQWKQRQDPTWRPQEAFRRLVLTEVDGQPVVELQQNYDALLIEQIKRLPQRKYVPARKIWVVPCHLDSLTAVTKLAIENGYEIEPDVQDTINDVLEKYHHRVELSHAKDGDYHIELPDGLELYPFQRIGVQYLDTVDNGLVADQMGLGKTVQALVAISVRNQYPAIVVCPASIKGHWARETMKWLPGKKVAILNGRKPANLKDFHGRCAYDILIVNYDVLHGWVDTLSNINPRVLVADECHRVKNPSAGRTKAVKSLIENVPSMRRIFLSGTPVVNRPMEFWTLISLLGYSSHFGGFAEYRRQYDNAWTKQLQELNTRARSYFMTRRMKADVLPELPEKQRIIVPIDIDNRREYTNAEQDIAGFFAQKKTEIEDWDEAELDAIKRAIALGLTGEDVITYAKDHVKSLKQETYGQAYALAARNEELLRWEALKQLSVKGKMKAVEAWIDEFLESDEKLVIFATHTNTIERLARKYNAPYIRGGVKSEERTIIEERFQNDPKCRVLIGNIAAMGEGLNLQTSCSNVCFVEFGWSPKDHDQAEDRLHRIGQKDSVTVWNLVAEGTIDEEICELIEKKREVTNAIQDGAGLDVQRQMMDELKASLNARVNKR